MSLTEQTDRAFERSVTIPVRFVGGSLHGQTATVRLDEHNHTDKPSGHAYARHTFGSGGVLRSYLIWDGMLMGDIQRALDELGKAP